MGALDDAIREHLELKRKHGAAEDEVAKQEKEALEVGALQSGGDERERPLAAPEVETVDGEPEARPESITPPDEAPGVGISDELAPDEVPPEEALEFEPPAPKESSPPGDGDVQAEDVLQETPDFLEEAPEHDRLWFEQRPPKDFDFDD